MTDDTAGSDATQFDAFWEASSLDRFNVREFARSLTSYDSDDKELILEYPESPRPLPSPRTRLGRLSRRRHSERAFSGAGLTERDLGVLLSSLRAWNGLEHRGYPSAGATYVTETFCVGFRAASLTGKVAYYDPEMHGLVAVSDEAPSWGEAEASLNAGVVGVPGLLVVLVEFPERATAKYGERGGRFALVEVGAAMQQLSLAVAGSRRLKGVILGGLLDEHWLRTLDLEGTDARVVLGYLVGR